MPLLMREVKVGNVAYFDVTALGNDNRVEGTKVPRPGPFVCVQVVDGKSTWAPLTTKQNKDKKRLAIKKSWRIDGSDQWRDGDIFLNDGANTHVGLSQAFVDAAADEFPFTKIKRPKVTSEGIAAVLAEIKKRKGTLL